jgi:multidrug efflux system membrane fusion protein
MGSERSAITRIGLPLGVLGVGVLGAGAMVMMRPEVETRRPEAIPPLVRVQAVELHEVELTVKSQGTVSPRTESQLVPEVAGRIIWVSPSYVSGGFFESGETLLRVDPHDYRQAVIQARAQVASARLRLAQEEAEAVVARKEWEELGEGDGSPLTLREPQLEDARAALASAEASLETAKRNLERTEIRAPYAGRLRQKNVDVGQFVTVGSPVARIYAVDYAEIRLPLPDDDLAFIDLPLDYRGEQTRALGPRVTLRADFAGRSHEWEGRIVRTEGEIDATTRMVHAVARVKTPYGRVEGRDRPPLAAGLYVQAEIEGRTVEGVAALPRAALRGRAQVLVVDRDDRLRFRDVDVLRATHDEIVVAGGLEEGERVCLSPMETVTDGMRVRTRDSSAETPGTPEGVDP